MGIVIALVGVVLVGGAVFDWAWFMENRRAVRLTRIVGRTAARAIYVALGLGGVITGILMTVGLLDLR
jgi:hypothetical protein